MYLKCHLGIRRSFGKREHVLRLIFQKFIFLLWTLTLAWNILKFSLNNRKLETFLGITGSAWWENLTDICACPRNFHGHALLMLNLGCKYCEKQNLLIIEQAPMGMGARRGTKGGWGTCPPPMEFETDDVICCSPVKYPNIFARAFGARNKNPYM